MCPESDEKDDVRIALAEPVLESPPQSSVLAPDTSILLTTESITQMSSKLLISESLWSLVLRETKYTDFVREILLIALAVVKSEAGTIFEVDTKKNSLIFRAMTGRSSDKLAPFEIPMGSGIVGHVAESKSPLVVSNVEENQFTLKSIQKAVGFEPRNIVAVPILIRGRVFGVIELLNRLGEDSYSGQDVEVLTYLAEMAAKAIEVRLMLAWSAKNKISSTPSSSGTKAA